MASVLRGLRGSRIGSTALALAVVVVTPGASASDERTSTVSANQTQVGGLALEIYNGQLHPGGVFKIPARGYASIAIDDASATMLVQCQITPTSSSRLLIAEAMRDPDTQHYELTGDSFEIPVSGPASVIEFAVTPELAGDYAYSIRAKDKAPFWLHTCTVTTPGDPSSSASAGPLASPRRITPTHIASSSGELALVEAQFIKWLREQVVFDAGKDLSLDVGASATDRTVVKCQVDLDLAEQTTFEIELVDKQTTLSKVVEQDGQLSFTLWGSGRVNIRNPTQIWVWRSCELV